MYIRSLLNIIRRPEYYLSGALANRAAQKATPYRYIRRIIQYTVIYDTRYIQYTL